MTDEALDRLIIEPLAAARRLAGTAGPWLDLGSGGGSPAIPLKILLPELDLTMVEAKTRKAAFLREAVRELGLRSARVETARFEDLPQLRDYAHSVHLITVRAIRVDEALLTIARSLLGPGGSLLLFQSSSEPGAVPASFQLAETTQLLPHCPSFLISLKAV